MNLKYPGDANKIHFLLSHFFVDIKSNWGRYCTLLDSTNTITEKKNSYPHIFFLEYKDTIAFITVAFVTLSVRVNLANIKVLLILCV